jgi:1-acyl-sn-glycerol-3-phosphate acyltransferase
MEAWVYRSAVELTASAAARTRGFPRDPEMAEWALRSVTQIGLRVFLRAYHRFHVMGRENLPERESFVMICNHASHLDALCLMSSLPLRRLRQAYAVAAADYFFSTPVRAAFTRIAVNGLPFDRQEHGVGGLDACRAVLAVPNSILIMFPEGTRTGSGALGRFRSGIARLVAGTNTPVVPCYLSGAFDAWPKGRAVPRPRSLRLDIGRPMAFRDISPLDRDALAAMCAQLRGVVASLVPRIDHAAAPFGRRSDAGRSASISSSE